MALVAVGDFEPDKLGEAADDTGSSYKIVNHDKKSQR
jgi:hypothetical protein